MGADSAAHLEAKRGLFLPAELLAGQLRRRAHLAILVFASRSVKTAGEGLGFPRPPPAYA
jgi:hypothetical protein